MKVICPECAKEFDAPKDVIVGEIITCPDCGLDLEIYSIGSKSISVKALKIEEEDWGE